MMTSVTATYSSNDDLYQELVEAMPDFMMNARLDPEGHGFYPDEDDIISIGSAIPTY